MNLKQTLLNAADLGAYALAIASYLSTFQHIKDVGLFIGAITLIIFQIRNNFVATKKNKLEIEELEKKNKDQINDRLK